MVFEILSKLISQDTVSSEFYQTVVVIMVEMNEHVISSTQEVTYRNSDIVDCVVASTTLDDTGL